MPVHARQALLPRQGQRGATLQKGTVVSPVLAVPHGGKQRENVLQMPQQHVAAKRQSSGAAVAKAGVTAASLQQQLGGAGKPEVAIRVPGAGGTEQVVMLPAALFASAVSQQQSRPTAPIRSNSAPVSLPCDQLLTLENKPVMVMPQARNTAFRPVSANSASVVQGGARAKAQDGSRGLSFVQLGPGLRAGAQKGIWELLQSVNEQQRQASSKDAKPAAVHAAVASSAAQVHELLAKQLAAQQQQQAAGGGRNGEDQVIDLTSQTDLLARRVGRSAEGEAAGKVLVSMASRDGSGDRPEGSGLSGSTCRMKENGSLQKQHSTLSSPQSGAQQPEDSHTNASVVRPQSLNISIASSRQPDILLKTKSPKEEVIRGIPLTLKAVSGSGPHQAVSIMSEGSLAATAASRVSGDHSVLVPLAENPSNLSQLIGANTVKNVQFLEALGANGAKLPLLVQLAGNARPQQRPQETAPSRQSGQTQTSSGLTSQQAVSSDGQQKRVRWRCTLSSKPTPQRNIQELFTVVGWVKPKLHKKLPNAMTVAEFENPKQLDCWPSEVSIAHGGSAAFWTAAA